MPPSDPASLAAALIELPNPGARPALGAAARRRVSDLYSVRRMLDSVAGVYEELLARTAPSRR